MRRTGIPRVAGTAGLVIFGLVALTAGAAVGMAAGRHPGESAQAVARPAGWSEASHGRQVTPDYARIFGTDRIHEIRIVIGAERFAAMQEDLRAVLPSALPLARGGGGGVPFPGGQPGRGAIPDLSAIRDACSGKTTGASCTSPLGTGQCAALMGAALMCLPQGMPQMGGRAGGLRMVSRDPAYFDVSVEFEGRTWTHVGMRYKGNSSLMAAPVSTSSKVPFRLDFDRYEKEVPAIAGQRLFGFGKLTFSSNLGDDSQMHEVLATEILRDRGVPAAHAAFYRVMVDTGAGPEYWGLYALVEDPADGAMLADQLGGRGGNLYKPDGPGADWSAFNATGFVKKSNEKAADFTDVERAIAALHADRTDAAAWRRMLESAFDVDGFLDWLAVNTAIENWDTYGVFAHNYYLYGDPAQQGRLRWIPWDHNFAFGTRPSFGNIRFNPAGVARAGGPPQAPAPADAPASTPAAPAGGAPPAGMPNIMFGGGGPAAGPMAAMFGIGNDDVLHRNAGSSWPLMQILLSDPVYAARYRTHLAAALDGLMSPDRFAARVRALHDLIASSITGDHAERSTHTTISSREAFDRSVDALISWHEKRRATIRQGLQAGS